MDKKKLKILAKAGIIPKFAEPIKIADGLVKDAKDIIYPYIIECGNNIEAVMECNEWRKYTYRVVVDFTLENSALPDLDEVIRQSIMIEDLHWDWLSKAIKLIADEYIWFYMKVRDRVEAVCIVYHPKESALSERNIYYIEYLSVAPWNRPSKLHPRLFLGIGTEMLREIQRYISSALPYEPGFCLHSLPQADEFYVKLGMITVPDLDKDPLKYFEMNKDTARHFMEA